MAATQDGLFEVDEEELRVDFEGHEVDALTPGAGGAMWAVVGGHSVWHRARRGTWRRVAVYDRHRVNCLVEVGGWIVMGTSKAHLVRLSRGRVSPIDAFDGAEGRAEWYTPWGGPPAVRSLARAADRTIYANVHVGGILRSDDAGDSWRQTIDIHCDVHEVVTVPERPHEVLAATARGLAVSDDGGATWRFHDHGLHASYCRAVAVSNHTVLLSASVGPHGGRAAVYRFSFLEGGRFDKCRDGLPEWFSDNVDSGCLTTSGSTAAFGTSDGRLFLSADAGLEWHEVASSLPPVRALQLEG
jgi:hypothetical protein